ncbi:MAG: GerMN domain-containing protein [Bacillota bacterium]
MKKLIGLIVLSLLSVTACSQGTQPQSTATLPPSGGQATATTMPTATITPGQMSPGATTAKTMAADYFAFKKDACMTYKGTGNEFAPYKAYVDYVKDGVVQTRQVNAGTTTVYVYKIVDGVIKKVYSKGEVYYKYDFTSLSNMDEILIKEPIQIGNSWKLKDGSVRSITALERQINTPSGSYKALEITTKRKDSTQKDYYAKGIGLVKTVFSMGDEASAVTSELEKTEIGVPYKTMVRFYFPDFAKDRLVYEDREIELKTDDDIKSKLEEELKKVPEGITGLTKTISDSVKILGISLDDKKGIITVDFSSDFIKGMNAGAALEGMLLKSITNTIGHCFQVSKVVITAEGKRYESGHFALKKGEYFTVSDDKTVQYIKP